MDYKSILPSVLLLLAAVVWHVIIFRFSPKLQLVKLNYNKKPIMASYGIVAFVYIAAGIGALTALKYAEWQYAKLYIAAMSAMWALGIIDDIFGSREVGGFKGHFKKLIFERKLTTGAVKAIGGGLVGLIAGWIISGGNVIKWLPASLVIPLSANILNLFDLRPGRAVAVFFFGLGVTYIWTLGSIIEPCIIGCIAVVAIAFGVFDSRGRAMMGDSGSNALGAALGLTIALNTNYFFQLVTIAVLVGIHVYSEKHSMTELIERNRVLSSIDRRLGVR